ncbi:MAG TPA: acetoacetate--CoA ligase [Bacillota bacterium]
MPVIEEGKLLWSPSEADIRDANLTRFMEWLAAEQGRRFKDYHDLWTWSTRDLEGFWGAWWRYCDIRSDTPFEAVLADRSMPGARWFPGARLNYAEHVFRGASDDRPALIAESELRPRAEVSWADLRRQVAAVAAGLRRMGVGAGDRVAAYLPNIPEAVVGALAAAAIGAVWSSCSPDFGTGSVVDRFRQIEPRVLFAVDGYRYGGRDFDRLDALAAITEALPTVEQVVLIPYLDPGAVDRARGRSGGPWSTGGATGRGTGGRVTAWPEFLVEGGAAGPAEPAFTRVPFDHPLWILYSSGTTGLPKPIVHGHGGILLEHLKVLMLHHDLKPGDRFFWFTTTGWMMWNYLISGLMLGCTLVLYDGSPGHPDLNRLWRLAAEAGIRLFGTSAPFITACMKAGIRPGTDFDLSRLRSVGSTGAPLSPDGFAWLHDAVKQDLWVASVSGGTDVCTAFVLGCPLLPVHAGEIQCRGLGARVEAFDPEGRPLTDEVGELVITEPLPSMPVGFWNDPDGSRYRDAYFTMYPGLWRHGDWIRITARGSAVIYGRSDATINRRGVRMGTADIYRALDPIPEVIDSLAVSLDWPDGESYLILFVVVDQGRPLDAALDQRIRRAIRDTLSPRHVPDEIIAAPDIPKTLNGKKMEVPIRRILMGESPARAANRDSMANPGALDFYVDLVPRIRALRQGTGHA